MHLRSGCVSAAASCTRAPWRSAPSHRRPGQIVQSDPFNRSGVSTATVVALTSNLRLLEAPGNALISAKASGLRRDAVVNVSQLLTIHRDVLTECVSVLAPALLKQVDEGLRFALDVQWAARDASMCAHIHPNARAHSHANEELMPRTVVFTPIAAILDAAGSSLDKLVSVTVELRDEEDFAAMNEECATWFPANPPARQGAKLPARIPGLRVSIAAIAEA